MRNGAGAQNGIIGEEEEGGGLVGGGARQGWRGGLLLFSTDV